MMDNKPKRPLTRWAQRVDAMHTRRESKEANEIRETLSERVLEHAALTEQIVLFLTESKAGVDTFADGSLKSMTSRAVEDSLSVLENAKAALGRFRGLDAHIEAGALGLQGAIAAIEERRERLVGRDTAKRFIEDHLAFLLAAYGVKRSTYPDGDLARTLRAAYQTLGLDVGTDPRTTIERLREAESFGFADLNEHMRYRNFYKTVIESCPITRNVGELEAQGQLLCKAVEAAQPEAPNDCIVVAERPLNL